MEAFGISLNQALDRISSSNTQLVNMIKQGSLSVDIYKPGESDKQKPHDRDEIYCIIQGNGVLNINGKETNCKQGDVLFVPAGTEHHFEGYSKDFCTWAIFYGEQREKSNIRM
jgi:mannose-6-phosphate isomerase-like protein (cupin superfamily)